ncbi:MAG TPA: hypothetical protein VG897_05105, partial [Terriglobales bacterium]|nr:hypothetical protein [Terriglobales bacterium]
DERKEIEKESDGGRSPSTGEMATALGSSVLISSNPQERSSATRALDLAQKARSSEPKRGIYDPYGCMPKNNSKEPITR